MTSGTGPDDVRAQQLAFRTLAAAAPDIGVHPDGQQLQFLYRPNQLLVPADQADRLRDLLRQSALVPGPDLDPGRPTFPDVGVELVHLEQPAAPGPTLTVPEIIDRIRGQDPTIDVAPNHVVFGAPHGNIMGHPDTPPLPAEPLELPERIVPPIPGGIAIIDSGIWQKALTGYGDAEWFNGLYDPDKAEIDGLFRPGTEILGLEAGHGTFIGGVIEQYACGVHLAPLRALDTDGIGDEATVAAALGRVPDDVKIVNLSLGFPTKDQTEAIGLSAAIAALPDDVVVVAAAGNTGSSEPHYPAASPGVIAVGATEKSPSGVVTRAEYSAWGDWIDVWAPGAFTSTYVTGRFALPDGSGPEEFTVPWASWEGTSFAAPYVAAWIAVSAARNRRSPKEEAELLLGSSSPGFPVILA